MCVPCRRWRPFANSLNHTYNILSSLQSWYICVVVIFIISGNFYFSFRSTSLAYITIPKNERNTKITEIKTNYNTYVFRLVCVLEILLNVFVLFVSKKITPQLFFIKGIFVLSFQKYHFPCSYRFEKIHFTIISFLPFS